MTRNYFFLLLILSTFPLHSFELDLPELPRPQATVMRMSRAQKIGQLFMVGMSSLPDCSDDELLETLVRDYHVGNIICMRGHAQRQKHKTTHLQSIATEPLLVGMDAEWGPNMRCSDAAPFPKQLALGAITDNHLIYEIGQEIGRQCKALGVHLNFAPVVDINDNMQNPIIGSRAFGDNQYHVSLKANAYMHGMHDTGVLGCAKHFPGHGDTTVDSHKDLPVLSHSAEHIREHNFYPFKRMIDAGVLAVMPGHIAAPALDPSGLPASLSSVMIRDILKQELRFRGLVITDGLYMQALYGKYSLPQICVKALEAGNDMLLVCDSRPLDAKMFREIVDAIDAIDAAVTMGAISEVDLDYHVEKIIEVKELIGLYDNRFPPEEDEQLTQPQTRALKQNLYSDLLTLVQNNSLLPIAEKMQKNTAHVQVGQKEITPFAQVLERVCRIGHTTLPSDALAVEVEMLVDSLKGYDRVVVSLMGMSEKPAENFGITQQILCVLSRLKQEKKKVALVLFGSPYALRSLGGEDAILVAYDNSIEAQLAAARIISGLDAPQGSLPVTVSSLFYEGKSLTW